ncbi:MAG: S-adenosylmethionine decarboxylase proenzyme [Bradymonadia bacterium]|jgi:S-adenosylmethionine decarboxylase proenzyme
MEGLGRHCIIEYYGCPSDLLDDPERVKALMCDAAESMGATIVAVEFHHFNPHGVSGMIVISESHLSVHTWPEYGYAAVDVFTCGQVVDPWLAHKMLKKAFGATRDSVIELKRGVLDVPEGTLPTEYDVKASHKPDPAA